MGDFPAGIATRRFAKTLPKSFSQPDMITKEWDAPKKPWETSDIMHPSYRLPGQVRKMWVSAQGGGGFHFPYECDAIQLHSRNIHRMNDQTIQNRGRVNPVLQSYVQYNILEHTEDKTEKTGKYSYLS